METRRPGVLSLRARLLGVVVVAILPLATVGAYLTRTAADAGADLLRDHLTAAADRMTAAMQNRWQFRESDLLLLANNLASQRILAGDAQPGDSAYLKRLTDQLALSIVTARLQHPNGETAWEYRADAAELRRPQGVTPSPKFDVAISVSGHLDNAGGVLHAAVLLTAVLPADSLRSPLPGARIAVRDRSGVVLLPNSEIGSDWLEEVRSMARPPLVVTLAAPLAPYTARYGRIAKAGVVALGLGAAAALLWVYTMTNLITAPLRNLAAAAADVGRGHYGRFIEPAGPSEVRSLTHAFNQMSVHLRDTLERLSRRGASEAVGEFATELSHDIRNALTSIKLDLERSLRRAGDGSHAELTARALHNIIRLEASVEGALRVARQAHQTDEEVDLRWPLQGAANLALGSIAAVPGTLHVDLPTSPLLVRGDAGALENMIANLLFNSAQAIRANGSVRAVAREEGKDVIVVIDDDGPGFRPQHAPGSGMGLPIARRIAIAHHGELNVANRTDGGARVTIRLPQST